MKKIMFNSSINWKACKEFEGLYDVSNTGLVKNHKTGKQLATHLNSHGYPEVILHKNNKSYLRRIHRLVAFAFVHNPNPDKYDCVNHKDENPKNNNVFNLEWCDRMYNNNYGGRTKRAAESHNKPILQFTLKGEFIKKWKSATEASRVLGFPQSAINWCCLKKPKYNSCKGFLWKYENDLSPITYKNGKRIKKLTKEGELIKEYPNLTQAATINNISITSITNCIYGRSKSAGGYKWKYC